MKGWQGGGWEEEEEEEEEEGRPAERKVSRKWRRED